MEYNALSTVQKTARLCTTIRTWWTSRIAEYETKDGSDERDARGKLLPTDKRHVIANDVELYDFFRGMIDTMDVDVAVCNLLNDEFNSRWQDRTMDNKTILAIISGRVTEEEARGLFADKERPDFLFRIGAAYYRWDGSFFKGFDDSIQMAGAGAVTGIRIVDEASDPWDAYGITESLWRQYHPKTAAVTPPVTPPVTPVTQVQAPKAQ